MKIVLLALLLTLSGCASLQNRPAEVALAVQLATLEFINAAEDPETRKTTIVNVVEQVRLQADQAVSIAQLVNVTHALIPYEDLTLSEELLIRYLVVTVASALTDKLGTEDWLGRERQVMVGEVLENVLLAVRIHR
jgi:hypothetical protein